MRDHHDRVIGLNSGNIDASPGQSPPFIRKSGLKDVRTLDKLYDGVNETYEDEHMWLAPLQFDSSRHVYLTWTNLYLGRILLWNYSKIANASIEIFVDDVLVTEVVKISASSNYKL